jgi:hypothetical protein
MLQNLTKEYKEERNAQDYSGIKKIRACPYYSPFKATCVNRHHPGFDEEFSRFPRCDLRGKYSECPIVDKVIELTLDNNNSVIDREYLYIKGRTNLAELEEIKNNEIL